MGLYGFVFLLLVPYSMSNSTLSAHSQQAKSNLGVNALL